MDAAGVPVSVARHWSRALGDGSRLHLAAHSHHLWADVTEAAQAAAWADAAALWDAKWAKVTQTVLPEARAHVARHLGLSDPTTIVFAPNTHDFVRRLLSALPAGRVPRLLTTDGEFLSFARQVERLEEDGLLAVTRVAVAPMETFQARFEAAARAGGHDLVFLSQVFFGSGFAVSDPAAIVRAVPDPATLVAIDGYHGFMARPTDLSAIEGRAFYMSGGYKYAGAGEGACFLHCPPGVAPRPRDTGWVAAFGRLSEGAGGVPYAADAERFAGATYDPTPLYRLNATMRLLQELEMDAAAIHAHTRAVARRFVRALEAAEIEGLREAQLIVPVDSPYRGNFLAYRSVRAPALQAALTQAGIVTDVRGETLRMGFGVYHEVEAAEAMAERVANAVK